MEQIKETLTSFYIGIAIYTVAVELVGIFFSGDILAYSLGLFLGTFVAVLLFHHMANTLDTGLSLPEAQAVKYIRKQSFIRLFIMLVAMVLGLLFSWINFIAVILGLLGLKIGALCAPFFLKRIYKEHYTTDTFDEESDREDFN